MKGWSKAVGTGLGYFVGGPIGAVLGYMAGDKLAPIHRAEDGHELEPSQWIREKVSSGLTGSQP